jgi:hypothetical protein
MQSIQYSTRHLLRKKFLDDIPTYSSKNSQEFFQVNFLDILFHWRQIVHEINLGIFLYQEVFPRKFLVQAELIGCKEVLFV